MVPRYSHAVLSAEGTYSFEEGESLARHGEYNRSTCSKRRCSSVTARMIMPVKCYMRRPARGSDVVACYRLGSVSAMNRARQPAIECSAGTIPTRAKSVTQNLFLSFTDLPRSSPVLIPPDPVLESLEQVRHLRGTHDLQPRCLNARREINTHPRTFHANPPLFGTRGGDARQYNATSAVPTQAIYR